MPRLIQFVLVILSKTDAKLETHEDVDIVLTDICFDSIQKYAPDSQKFKIDEPVLKAAAVQLLLASQMGEKLKLKYLFKVIDPVTNKSIESTVEDWLG